MPKTLAETFGRLEVNQWLEQHSGKQVHPLALEIAASKDAHRVGKILNQAVVTTGGKPLYLPPECLPPL